MIPTSAMEIRDRLSKYQFGSGRERTARVARRQDLANLDGPRIRAGSKRERLLSRCARRERFLTHTANAFPPNALVARNITAGSPTLPPSHGEAASSMRLFSSARDEKSLISFRASGKVQAGKRRVQDIDSRRNRDEWDTHAILGRHLIP